MPAEECMHVCHIRAPFPGGTAGGRWGQYTGKDGSLN